MTDERPESDSAEGLGGPDDEQVWRFLNSTPELDGEPPLVPLPPDSPGDRHGWDSPVSSASASDDYPSQDLRFSPEDYPSQDLHAAPVDHQHRGSPTASARPSVVITPFQRLARVHAAVAATDAVIAVALAGSIFFTISPDAARSRVALYLALTMAPFAVVTPLIGPVIDRLPGGRRAMILVTGLGRLIVAFLMIRHIDTLWLFPEAFVLLILQKTYSVAKSAVVPRYVVSESTLVHANSRLTLISAVLGLAGAGIGAALIFLGGPPAAAGAATVGYGAAVALALRLPRIPVAPTRTTRDERSALRASRIVLSASAMAVLRGSVGFVTFLLAFELRGGEEGLDVSAFGAAAGGSVGTARGVDVVGDPGAPAWHFAVVVAAAGLAAFAGVQLAPVLRRAVSEEVIFRGALATGFAAAALASLAGGLSGMAILSAGLAIAAGIGKLAFDSLVQRDAPEANHGRSFARFEARFQIAWVVGAFVPVILPVPARLGAMVVAAVAGFALVSYMIGSTRQRAR